MNLDTRARRAAAQLHAAVEERPLLGAAPLRRPHVTRIALAAGSVVAIAAVGFVVLRDTDPGRDQSVAAGDRTNRTTDAPLAAGGGDLPDGWARCADRDQGYSVGHPDRWYTISKLPEGAVDAGVEVGPCRFFDPVPFEIVAASEWPTTALEVLADAGAYDERSRNVEDPNDHERILLWQPETVQGRRAVRVERESTGKGLYSEGLRYYGWIIDRDGQAFTVGGFWAPGAPITNSEQKAVVDEAVQTLEFDSVPDSPSARR